jgi:hypothetical protein
MNAETIYRSRPPAARDRARRWFFIFALLAAVVSTCGPKKISQPGGAIPTRTSERWMYMSELDPIRDIRVSGDTIWALTSSHLLKAHLSGSESLETIDMNLSREEADEIRHLLVDSGGEVWVAGGNDLYAIQGNTITHIDEIKLNFKTITLLEGLPGARIFVGGENVLAALEGGAWKLRELPFHITGGTSAGEEVVMMAAERGIAKIEGDTVTEYPHPLSDVKPYNSGHFIALSVAQAKTALWVLWTGDGSYLSVLHPSGDWSIFTYSPDRAGLPLRLLRAGDRIILETQHGFFRIEEGSVKGVALLPAGLTMKAKKMVYDVPGHDILQEGTGYADLKPFTFKPVPRIPISVPQDAETEKGTSYTLVPLSVHPLSPLRAIDGTKDFIIAGTEAMGVQVLRDDGSMEKVFYTFNAKPALPFTLFKTSSDNVMYPLESGEVGVLSGSRIRKVKVGEKPDEKVMGVDGTKDAAYAITLTAPADTVDIYRFQVGRFEKLIERTVDLATGIGSIGSFAVAPNGTFWFTIKSYGEGQEMGAAEIRPELGGLVYDGAIPTPPEHALIIPNGVSSLKIKPDGTVYLGGMEGFVLIRPDRSIKKFHEPEGLVGDFVTDLTVDADGRVWIVTVEGLGYLEKESLFFPSGIPYRGSGVVCVGTAGDGRALIVDEDGLKVFDRGAWKLLASRSEIVGSPVLDVQGDGIGNIWVVTKRCISIFREK